MKLPAIIVNRTGLSYVKFFGPSFSSGWDLVSEPSKATIFTDETTAKAGLDKALKDCDGLDLVLGHANISVVYEKV